MTITSISYVAFLMAVILAYFVVPKKYQWVIVLIANVIFYLTNGAKYIIYIILASAVTFAGAIVFENINIESKAQLKEMSTPDEKRAYRAAITKKKKEIAFVLIFAVMGVWATIKYGNFAIENLNALFRNMHIDMHIGRLNLMMPLGMSFFSFQAVGYMVDVYRSKYPAQRNFLKYFTFVSFFPHILQGPFSRFDILGQSILEEHKFSYDRLCAGTARIIWGFFKKIVIADQIGISVDKILDNYQDYPGMNILLVVFLYAIQIYADFSGYMDIVCGFSRILDINLQENFNQPYFAKSIDEFWRRWHMTISQWFRDYMFYPVSMSKVAQKIGKNARNVLGNKWGRLLPSYFALIFVWTCTGLWHGANWTYLIWGYLNFIVITCGMHWADYYRKAREICHIKEGNILWEGFRILRTFALVSFFRFFAVSDTVGIAFGMLKRIFTDFNCMKVLANPTNIFPGLNKIEIIVLGIGAIILIVVDVLRELDKWETVKQKTPLVCRCLAYAFLILMIYLIVPSLGGLETGAFMYANF